ncbi:SDR family oxidoreductase [Gordonia araii]|nr:SDR family oxidoreductase [Gordonia araii]NNG97682.1 SDR family oxidoreductase [Gordonia araii NBRC 100433]
MAKISNVNGTTVIITGGARGIGAATAALFVENGARVWIGDVDADEAAAAATRIGARSAALDVTDRQSWTDFLSAVEEADGTPGLLVNNAGVMPLGGFDEESEEITDLILDVNVRGVLNGMRAVVPGMVAAGGGQIINVASMAGMIPIPGMVTYNASKFAVVGATLAARREYAPAGVSVSAILPSAVRTELSSGAELGGGMPTVDPEDVARAILDVTRSKSAITSVPKWVAKGWRFVDALVPEWVETGARKLLRDRRALEDIDADGRRAYTDRIARHAADHGGSAGQKPAAPTSAKKPATR